MSLQKHDIEKIAHLARLSVLTEDTNDYAKNLFDILGLVEQMNQIDTHNITPMAHPLDGSQRLRPDVVSEANQREHFQKIAPLVENNLYLVPKVIE